MVLFLLALLLAVIVGLFVIKAVVGFAIMVLLAGLIGAAAKHWVGYRGGFLYSIGAGLLGAVVGTVFANLLNAPKWPELYNLPLLWTAVGAVAVSLVAKVVTPLTHRARLGSGDRRALP
jgi:uncharacterized membrane protein YeaQ/YmgE (transglycosylase-associated protein family)